jgi:hypothetical protein
MRVRVVQKGYADFRFNIQQLCPIPQGPFHANGNLTIPDQFVNQIPSIAFSVPDVLHYMALLTYRSTAQRLSS